MKNYDYSKNALDVFRIIATVQVFLGHIITHFHMENPPTKIIYFVQGVPILFALCGFLAAMSVNRYNIKEWLFRRAVRILPAFWFCIIVNSIVILIVYSVKPTLIQGAVYAVTQFFGLNFYTGGWLRDYGVGVPNGVLWTIPVQIQFFILVPLINKFLKKRSLKISVLFVLALTLISILCERSSAFLPEIIVKLIGVTVIPYLYFLVLGMIAWYHRDSLIPFLSKYKWYILAIYTVWKICELNFEFPKVLTGVMYNTLSTVLICSVIFAFAFDFKWRMKNDLSYGFYLYHMVFVNLAVHFGFNSFSNLWKGLLTVTAIAALTLVAAFISQNLIERPATKIKIKSKETK